MTNEEAVKMLTAKVECMKRESSGTDLDCIHRNCDECELCYAQGTTGEQKEALKVAIEALQNSPSQMSGASDAEFWKKRALEYSKTCCDLLARLSNGTKVDSIQLNENGISFHISTQPEQNSPLQMPETSDLISRQDAIDAMTNTLWHYPNGCYRNLNEYEFAKGLAELGLKSVPSAQPERKPGKWIEVNDAYNRISGRCSVCGWESHLYEDDVVGMDYCPNCGARLEVE